MGVSFGSPVVEHLFFPHGRSFVTTLPGGVGGIDTPSGPTRLLGE
jgi:hypothetical protein